MSLPLLQDQLLEQLARLLGEWDNGVGISLKLSSLDLFDNNEGMTKWRRLMDAFKLAQRQDRDCRRVLQFIGEVVAPVNYVGKASLFHDRQNQLNEFLVFAGIRYTDDGKFVGVESALSVEDSLKKVSSLKRRLIELKVHAKVLEYCTEELVSKDVFHAVLEACKGLFQTIREKSGYCEDGAALIDKVFNVTSPVLALNTLRTETEKSEQKGFASLLKGCASACRNPAAHEPRILWGGTEEDAFDSLMLVSLLHKKLDKCTRVLQ